MSLENYILCRKCTCKSPRVVRPPISTCQVVCLDCDGRVDLINEVCCDDRECRFVYGQDANDAMRRWRDWREMIIVDTAGLDVNGNGVLYDMGVRAGRPIGFYNHKPIEGWPWMQAPTEIIQQRIAMWGGSRPPRD